MIIWGYMIIRSSLGGSKIETIYTSLEKILRFVSPSAKLL
jgi:hypothetical protein